MENQASDRTVKIKVIESRLEELASEQNPLVSELARLRDAIPNEGELPALLGIPVTAKTPESSEDKISLFLKLFRARESVFPKLWENRTKGTKGYSPACNNEWVPGFAESHRSNAPIVQTRPSQSLMSRRCGSICKANTRSEPMLSGKTTPALFSLPISMAMVGGRTCRPTEQPPASLGSKSK